MKQLATFVVLGMLLTASNCLYAELYDEITSDDDNPEYSYIENEDDSYIHSGYIEDDSAEEAHSYEEDHESHNSHAKMPSSIFPPGEKVIVVNPRVHAWGAYNRSGKLLRSGRATSGSSWCADLDRPCRTKTGTFRIFSLGNADCYSKRFPLGEGGAPMPYCMYFNGGQGIHGSYEVKAANVSHGCVRVSVSDAKWLRYNFAEKNTKVIIKPY